MKKTLSIILAILMIVTTIPFAFAADNYVAKITANGETTYYETFPDISKDYRNTAITVDLLTDVEYEPPIPKLPPLFKELELYKSAPSPKVKFKPIDSV